MKFKNKLLAISFYLLLILPINTYAYSNYVISGGETIGIEVNSKGVLVVGFYKIDNEYIAKDAGFAVGDLILEVNDTPVDSIEAMVKTVEESSSQVHFTVSRDDTLKDVYLTLKEDENQVLKTGLYVKDKINGIGTLTYIDPNSKIFGALGHEIIEKTTGQKLEIKDGKIYSSEVTGVTRSTLGKPGEKSAKYDSNDVFGSVFENTTHGIFGNYTDDIPNKKLYAVGTAEDIKTGEATILTVVDGNTVEEFNINILKVNSNENVTKNILFEVTDENLLKTTGGIIQGMSGSPIIQNEHIIGAVTHVVVDDPTKGYGILITTMLEEAEN